MRQEESLKVIKAPLPGLLPEYSSISVSMNLRLKVAVNEYHLVSLGFEKNGSGLPSLSGFLLASFSHNEKLGGLSGRYRAGVR
jgi:hypothetical protein